MGVTPTCDKNKCYLCIDYIGPVKVYSIHTYSNPWFYYVPLAQRIARWTSNPKVLGSIPRWDDKCWSCGVVVITSALHAEGRQFDPGRDHILFTSLHNI